MTAPTQQEVRGALQARLATLTWNGDTAYEGKTFAPTAERPYQALATVFADPLTPGLGAGYADRGFFQVSVYWPVTIAGKEQGIGDLTARCEAVRALFPMNHVETDDDGRLLCKIIRAPAIIRLPDAPGRNVSVVRSRFITR